MTTSENIAEPLLSVEGLRVSFDDGARKRDIVVGADIEVGRGEAIAIVGESGSGKSLCARAMIRLLPRNIRMDGSVRFLGRDIARLGERELARLRGDSVAMLFQDPYTMLNPLLRNGTHVEETLCARGERIPRATRRAEIARRLAEVGIDDAAIARRYPYELSGGMRQRVALAATLARDPELLIADEPTTALDVMTQAEILKLVKSLQEKRGMGLVLITHDLRVAFSVCDRVYVMYAGRLLEIGRSAAVEREPVHPYTLSLLLSEPAVDRRQRQLISVGGSVPEPAEVAGMCAFAPRCAWTADVCRAGTPELATVEGGRRTACVRLEEIRELMRSTRSTFDVSEVAEADAPATPTEATAPLIEVRELRKVFASGGREVEALRGASIRVDPGESVGLVGASGSGKTTLGRLLIGLETPTSGSIAIDGVDCTDIAGLRSAERSTLRRTVQMVFQDPYSSLNPMQTVGATLGEVLAIHGHPKSAVRSRATELLELVELPASYASRLPSALSGGERQRVAIARALAVGRPRLLICDEPVSALDVSVQAQILMLFRRLRDEIGLGYLFITHDLAVVRQVVTRIYVMNRGEIVEEGLVDDVLDAPRHPYTRRLIAAVPTHSGEPPRHEPELAGRAVDCELL